ncbi:hypothetical protein D3C85_506090 [compost metagenome]
MAGGFVFLLPLPSGRGLGRGGARGTTLSRPSGTLSLKGEGQQMRLYEARF